MRPVVLFDIDGTLVDTAGASGAAFSEGFRSKFNIEKPARLKLHGRTDRGIAKQLFDAHGIANNNENFHQLTKSYLERLPRALADYPGYLLEGVHELLTELNKLDVEIALLTGNLRHAAFAKVNHFGIGRYFGWGFFGDHHDQRVNLGRHARQALLGSSNRGKKNTSHQEINEELESIDLLPESHPIMRPQSTNRMQLVTEKILANSIIIGDTPLDVQCAKEMQVRSLAVCTGGFSHDQLSEHEPDAIHTDLTATSALVDFIMDTSL